MEKNAVTSTFSPPSGNDIVSVCVCEIILIKLKSPLVKDFFYLAAQASMMNLCVSFLPFSLVSHTYVCVCVYIHIYACVCEQQVVLFLRSF